MKGWTSCSESALERNVLICFNVIKIVACAAASLGYMSRHIQVRVEANTQIPCRRHRSHRSHRSHMSFTNLDAVDRHLSQRQLPTNRNSVFSSFNHHISSLIQARTSRMQFSRVITASSSLKLPDDLNDICSCLTSAWECVEGRCKRRMSNGLLV